MGVGNFLVDEDGAANVCVNCRSCCAANLFTLFRECAVGCMLSAAGGAY